MAKIFYAYKKYVDILKEEYKSLSLDNELQKYSKKIQLGKVVFWLSYLEVCLPYSFYKIQKDGVQGYLSEINEHIGTYGFLLNYHSLDEEEALFTRISIGLILKEPTFGLHYDYQHIEAHKFINCLINEPLELKNIVNGFTTKEQEYYDAIDNDKLNCYDEQELKRITLCILQNFCYENTKEGQRKLQKILSYMYSQNIAIDFIFENDTAVMLTENLCIMEIVYNVYCKDNDVIKCSDKIFKTIDGFSTGERYVYDKFLTICKFLRYFNNNKRDINTNRQNELLSSNMSTEDKIDQFIKDNNDIIPIGDSGSDISNNLIRFTKIIEQKVIDNELGRYPDFQEAIKRMKNSVNDINFFLKIQKSICTQNAFVKDNIPTEINQGNISDWIGYFNCELSKNNTSSIFYKNVFNFFKIIESHSNISLSSDNIKELQEFLSGYYELRGDEIFYHRGVLDQKSNAN